jgi:uncharacterized protein
VHARPKLSAADVIRLLDLKPHSEGGHFRETLRDHHPSGTRAHSTGIYFLLAAGERSHWHKVDAVEVWHYYAGAALTLEIAATAQGPIDRIKLGPDLAAGERPQAAVPAHVGAGRRRRARANGRWSSPLHRRARFRLFRFRTRPCAEMVAGRWWRPMSRR